MSPYRFRNTVESPVTKAIRMGATVGLANHTLLIASDGNERAIDDSAAPIRDNDGKIIGVVLVFHDITERMSTAQVKQRGGSVRFKNVSGFTRLGPTCAC